MHHDASHHTRALAPRASRPHRHARITSVLAVVSGAAALASPGGATLYDVHAAGFGTILNNGVCTFRDAVQAAVNDTAGAECPARTANDAIGLLDTGLLSLSPERQHRAVSAAEVIGRPLRGPLL